MTELIPPMVRPLYVYVSLALITGLFLGSTVAFWDSPSQIQAIGAIGAFTATMVLVGLTFAYVRTNQDSLALLREQWVQQRKVNLRFGIRKAQRDIAQLWVANIGLSDVLLCKVTIQRVNKGPSILYKNSVIKPGQKRFFELRPEKWKESSLPGSDIDIALTYESLGEAGTTEGKAYNIATSLSSDTVIWVKKGIHGLWSVHCPKCHRWDGMYVDVEGLHTFVEAQAKRRQMEDEVGATCPNHQSDLMLTADKVRQRRPSEEED